MNDTDVEIIYVADPMCSWCWGYAPEISKLVEHEALPLRLVMGGLRPGSSAQTLGDGLREMLLHHWEQVGQMSGQPFNQPALEAREASWLYDTELPARAVVAMRHVDPSREMALLHRLQRAFYAEGIDVTDPEVYPSLLEPYGLDTSAFVDAMLSEAIKTTTWADYAWAREYGISGFPSTLLRTGDRLRLLASGFQKFDQVDAVLHSALERFAPTAAAVADASCSLGAEVCE